MANYSIPRSRDALSGGGDVTVTEATVNQTTAVSLVGQNFTGYGDEIATNFLQMLENFAADTSPDNNPRVNSGLTTALTGQLWYDTGNSVLKVYDGAGWQEQSAATAGTVESSVLRWNNTNSRWQEEERVRITEAGSLQIALNSGTTNQVNFNHGGTNFTSTFSGTTDWRISGLGGDLTLLGGSGFSVENGGSAIALNVNGSSQAVWTAAAINSIVYPAGVKLAVGASTLGRAGLNLGEGTAPSSPVDGDIWITSSGVFARRGTSTVQLDSAAGGTVTSTGSPADNQIAIWTATPDQLEGTTGLTYNGTALTVTGNVTATQIGGIAEANLVDKNANESIAGQWTFTNATAPILVTAEDIQVTGGFGYVTSDSTLASAWRADNAGNKIDFTHTNTPYWSVQGLSRAEFASPIYATSISSAATFRSIGDASTWNTADSFISFYDSDQSEHGLQIGTLSGSTTAIVNSRIGALDLYASNTRVYSAVSFGTTFYVNGATQMSLVDPASANHSSSLIIYDRNDEDHPAGFNGTPLADNASDDINSANRTMGLQYVGKFVSRTTSSSRTFSLIANAPVIPVGATVILHNDNSSGTFTVVQVTNTTLQWVDGSGSAPTTGTRTLAYNSVATLRKKSQSGSTSVWQIWGNGIS